MSRFGEATAIDGAVQEAVTRLAEAARTGHPCPPVRDLIGADDVARAYLVQEQLIAAQVAAGARRVGRKIGLTSQVVQKQLGVDQPDFGTLLDDMSVGPDRVIPAGRLLQPRIEAEIAFVLTADLPSTGATLEEVTDAIGTVHAALEIVDSRIAGWDIRIADTVADNASSGMFVLGDNAVPLADIDPLDVQMEMDRDGVAVSSGRGAACLGNPLAAVLWLARVAASFGRPLLAGEVILSGALGPMVPARPGEAYTARLSGLGNVQCSFATGGIDR
ncbi:MAG TPA: fumarylacetoacetate hydrolase family protein [Blastococcus sp.]